MIEEPFPWCSERRDGDLRAVRGLHGAQAGAGRHRSRRPAAVLARAGARRGDRAAAGGVVRPRADRRVPGRQRPAGRPGAGAGLVRLLRDRGRRRLPGDLRLPLRVGRPHPRLPGALRGHARGDAGAQLPLDAAGPGRRERGGGAGACGRSRSACAPTARAARARGWCSCATSPRRPRRSATASWRRASRARCCATRPCWRAPRTTPTCWSSSSPAAAIPFHKYGGLRYLEAAHVKDFVALLRLADNGADDVAWFRVLQLIEGVGPASARGARLAGDGRRRGRRRLAESRRATRSARARAAPAGAGPARRVGLGARRDPIGGPRERGRADRGAASRRARSRGPGRGPRSCARCSRRWSAPRYPDGAVRVADLDQLVAAAHQASDPRHFVAELVLDPPHPAPTSPSRRTWTRTT